ncbi:MAG: DUF3862 domain-containing protein [Sulfurospirillaceae bacterium]|nr:DUF3862 domain-containing protein [Sulfurospirillaceae bacterium]
MRYMTLILALFIFMGCSKISKESYDKLKVGMSYPQVMDILGKADRCDAMVGVSTCTWGDTKRYINVKFMADKVIFMNSENIE